MMILMITLGSLGLVVGAIFVVALKKSLRPRLTRKFVATLAKRRLWARIRRALMGPLLPKKNPVQWLLSFIPAVFALIFVTLYCVVGVVRLLLGWGTVSVGAARRHAKKSQERKSQRYARPRATNESVVAALAARRWGCRSGEVVVTSGCAYHTSNA